MHIFANAGIDNINSNEKQLLYTCEPNPNKVLHSAIQLLMINNISESNQASVTVTIHIDRLKKDIIILKESKIETGSALIVERVINLQPGDSIFIQAKEENTLSVFCSILEVT